MTKLTVENSGRMIVATNYWASEWNRTGHYFLSVNAGAFRLLVPESLVAQVQDMATAVGVAITRGPMPRMQHPDMIEVLFDDGSPEPFLIHLEGSATDRAVPPTEAGREAVCTVWIRDKSSGAPHQVLERPCRVRFGTLPDMRPWNEASST